MLNSLSESQLWANMKTIITNPLLPGGITCSNFELEAQDMLCDQLLEDESQSPPPPSPQSSPASPVSPIEHTNQRQHRVHHGGQHDGQQVPLTVLDVEQNISDGHPRQGRPPTQSIPDAILEQQCDHLRLLSNRSRGNQHDQHSHDNNWNLPEELLFSAAFHLNSEDSSDEEPTVRNNGQEAQEAAT